MKVAVVHIQEVRATQHVADTSVVGDTFELPQH